MKEEWRDINGYEGYYQASNTGKIRSLNYNHTKKTKVLKGGLDKDGYRLHVFCVNGVRKTVKSHRVILETFKGLSKGKPMVNHINGIKNDNRLENLEWSTNKDNQLHAYKIGLHRGRKGKENGMYGKKHSKETIDRIKKTLSIHFANKRKERK